MKDRETTSQSFWEHKKVLISGATGFIGSEVTRELIYLNADVAVITRTQPSVAPVNWIKVEDDQPFPVKEVENFHPHIVIHLATLFKASHDESDIRPLIRSNIEFGTHLLDVATHLRATFINVSSYWQHHNGEPYSPVSLYAATKQAFLDIAQYYAELGLDFRNLTIYDTYGLRDQRNKIVSQLINAGMNKQRIDMGSGDQLINLLFLEDVVSAIFQLAELSAWKQSQALDYVVRTESSISIRELVEVIEKVTHSEIEANWGARPARMREMTSDWCFGKLLPGWEQSVSLEDGIRICWQELNSAT